MGEFSWSGLRFSMPQIVWASWLIECLHVSMPVQGIAFTWLVEFGIWAGVVSMSSFRFERRYLDVTSVPVVLAALACSR